MTKSGKKMIPISIPSTGEEEWQALREPLETGWLTSGPKVKEFEKRFSDRHRSKHGIAVTSATTALHLACLALGVQPGDEVIVPAFTWISTANAVIYCGAKVVFADIDPDTFNMDPAKLALKITSKTKAIIPVHLFGLSADIEAIQSVSRNIPLIEDCACSAGASYKNKPTGTLGKVGCFSFHPRKSITTGEGGMITTDDDELASLVTKLRNHGASVSEEERHSGPKPFLLPSFEILGYNFRMTDIQAALGIVQLSKLDRFIDEREKLAKYYHEKLAGISWLKLPHVPNEYRHGWQSYVTMVDEKSAPFPRNKIMEVLMEQGIASRPGTHAVHMLTFYKKLNGTDAEDFPISMRANNQSMALPMHNHLSNEDIDYIAEVLQSI